MKGKARGRTAPPRPAGKAVTEGFRNLQRGLTGDRGLVGKSYMDDSGMLSAYLGYYWPASRAQCLAILDRIAFLEGRRAGAALPLPVNTLIDVGSGPGPIAAAFASRGATKVSLLDQSPDALSLARKKVGLAEVSTLSCDIRNPDPARIAQWGKADCVAFGHSLNELWARAEDRVSLRARLLERYAAALSPGGFILVLEPALLGTSRDLIAVRNLLVAKGWEALAPCPGRERLPCPALDAGLTHTCHEAVRWDIPEETSRLARSLGLDREWLKMAWFALRPPRPEGAPSGEERPLYRIVSDPMRNKSGRVRKLLCGATGRFPLSAPTADGKTEATGFPAFDRLERGDYLLVTEPEIRENGWGMSGKTALQRLFPVIS